MVSRQIRHSLRLRSGAFQKMPERVRESSRESSRARDERVRERERDRERDLERDRSIDRSIKRERETLIGNLPSPRAIKSTLTGIFLSPFASASCTKSVHTRKENNRRLFTSLFDANIVNSEVMPMIDPPQREFE